jgi:hypothetical protein
VPLLLATTTSTSPAWMPVPPGTVATEVVEPEPVIDAELTLVVATAAS